MLKIKASDFKDAYTAEAYIRQQYKYTKLHSDWHEHGIKETLACLILENGRRMYFREGGNHSNDFWQQWIDEEDFARYEAKQRAKTMRDEGRDLLEDFELSSLKLTAITNTARATVLFFEGDGIEATIKVRK